MRRKLFSFTFLFFMISSCGADRLKKMTNTSNLSNLGESCSCVASYSPVCGDNKDEFENSCLAQCHGARVITPGHCICSNTQIVCGIDNIEYTECEAREANIEIKKFVPCGSSEL